MRLMKCWAKGSRTKSMTFIGREGNVYIFSILFSLTHTHTPSLSLYYSFIQLLLPLLIRFPSSSPTNQITNFSIIILAIYHQTPKLSCFPLLCPTMSWKWLQNSWRIPFASWWREMNWHLMESNNSLLVWKRRNGSLIHCATCTIL